MNKKLSFIQTITIGFLCIIFLGTVLLCLPISTRGGQTTSVANAFFTASSATCVTGLVAFDTYQHWTAFGQGVILGMIQIGGLGFMTLATMFSLILRRKISLKERGLMQEAINSPQIGGIVKLAKHVLIGTIFFETAGAFLLAIRFIPRMGVARGLWSSVFHSVSAFCNAGFDLMGRFRSFSSFTAYYNDPYVNIVLMVLIVVGGLGFYVWDDLYKNRHHFHQYKLHTKMVLSATAFLIFVPAVLFFLLEKNNGFSGMSTGSAALSSFFQSVTCRTAGFNTVDMNTLSDSSALLSCIRMLIGGSPGSTAGGIKTTTFLVLVLSVISMVRKEKSVTVYNRRLEEDMLKRVSSILVIYLFVSLLSIGVICAAEGTPLKETMFEVFSAIGTVGLSMGLTPTLSVFSKILLAFVMFFGRIGGLSLTLAFAQPLKAEPVQHAVEKISVG